MNHQVVRTQAAATAVFLARHTIEHMLARNPAAVADGRVGRSIDAITHSLDATGLAARLSTMQRELMALEPGTWPAERLARYKAMWETQGTLMWALQRMTAVPPFWEPFDQAGVFGAVAMQPSQPETIAAFVGNERVRLTLRDDIERMRDRAEAWHWRARAYVVQRASERVAAESKGEWLPPGLRGYLRNIDAAVKQAAVRACADGLIDYTTEDDFAVNDTAYRAVPVPVWQRLEMIAHGRLSALGWILGTYEWDVAPDDLTAYASPMAAMFAPPSADDEAAGGVP